MKMKLLLIILLLSITISRKIQTTEQTKSKISDSYTWYVYFNGRAVNKCTVKRADFEYKSTNKKSGLFLSNCSMDFDKVFEKVKDGWILPYKFVNSDSISWGTDAEKYSQISLLYQNGTSSKIAIDLKFVSPSISFDDHAQVVSWIGMNVKEGRTAWKKTIQDVLDNATSYYNTKQSSKAAEEGIAGIDKQISAFQTSIKTLQEKNAADETKLKEIETQINQLSIQKESLGSGLISSKAEITKTQKDIDALNATKTSKSTDTSKFQEDFATAEKKWTASYNDFRTQAKGQEATVDQANTELTKNNSLVKAQENINKVWPKI
jgi:predicted  nucleic acid-binding Zn-ribbon protein